MPLTIWLLGSFTGRLVWVAVLSYVFNFLLSAEVRVEDVLSCQFLVR